MDFLCLTIRWIWASIQTSDSTYPLASGFYERPRAIVTIVKVWVGRGGSSIFTRLEVYREAGALRVEMHEKAIMEYSDNNYDRQRNWMFFYDEAAFTQCIIHVDML